MKVEYSPSDEIDAPESRKSSEPIWMGKTFSWGRICGISVFSFLPGGGWRGSVKLLLPVSASRLFDLAMLEISPYRKKLGCLLTSQGARDAREKASRKTESLRIHYSAVLGSMEVWKKCWSWSRSSIFLGLIVELAVSLLLSAASGSWCGNLPRSRNELSQKETRDSSLSYLSHERYPGIPLVSSPFLRLPFTTYLPICMQYGPGLCHAPTFEDR